MRLNLNKLLLSLSAALDYVAIDLLGVINNHSKRVAYMGCQIGRYLNLSEKELFDLVSLAVLHDNGVAQSKVKTNIRKFDVQISHKILEGLKQHCIIGEKNIKSYPFFTNVEDVILYHHEHYDGSGYFGLAGDEIPLMSQILIIADRIEVKFDLRNVSYDQRDDVIRYIREKQGVLFSKEIVDAFISVSDRVGFWLDLKDIFIDKALESVLPIIEQDIGWEEIRNITKTFNRIIDAKSKFTQEHSKGLAEKTRFMSKYYGMEQEKIMQMVIAADLHDLGKLAISNDILDKPGKLTVKEMNKVKEHTYYTRKCISSIEGFDNIANWASNHHEKLNGIGYPYGLQARELDFESRMLCCLDIYQALTEDRPYRKGYNHKKSMNLISSMAARGEIDKNIVQDIHEVFREKMA